MVLVVECLLLVAMQRETLAPLLLLLPVLLLIPLLAPAPTPPMTCLTLHVPVILGPLLTLVAMLLDPSS